MLTPELKQRIFFSTLMVLLLALFIVLAPFQAFRPIFTIALALVAAVGLWEYYKLAQKKGLEPAQRQGIVWSCLYIILTYLVIQKLLPGVLQPIILGLAIAWFFFYFFSSKGNALANLAVTSFGLFYVTLPLSFFLEIIYHFPSPHEGAGQWWFSYMIVVTVMTDVGAYFAGKKFGKKKLAPNLSPGKTIEGAAGGLMLALIASLVMYFINSAHLSFFMAVLLGILFGIVGQAGDLAESLLKRDAGVKDSNGLPGLGGVLDIVDSLLFTAPLTYLVLLCIPEAAPLSS